MSAPRRPVVPAGVLLAVCAWLLATPARAQLEAELDAELDTELEGTTDAASEEAEQPAEPTEDAEEADATTESAADETQASDAAAAEEPASDAGTPSLRASVRVGAGVGTLGLTRPTDQGRQRLPRSAFAAAGVSVGLHFTPEEALSFEVSAAYASSIGFALQVEPLFGLAQRVEVRAQRLELLVAPHVKLGTGKTALALAFPVGFALRSFVPDLHQFGLPNHLLGGPELRVELVAPLGEHVRVRIGPEAQWLLLVDRSLRDQGACCQGVAVGGQASLETNVSTAFSVGIAVRESHAFVGSGAHQFSDAERFVTALVGGRL